MARIFAWACTLLLDLYALCARLVRGVLSSALCAFVVWVDGRRRRREETAEAVDERQRACLMRLLRSLEETARGRELGLGAIHSVEDFCARVPLTTYAEYEGYVERVAEAGEANVLSPDPVIYFATSSGTTGKRKMLPVTRALLASLRPPTTAAFAHALSSGAMRFGSRGLLLSIGRSLARTPRPPAGIPYGPLSQLVTDSRLSALLGPLFKSLFSCAPTAVVDDADDFEAAMMANVYVGACDHHLPFISTAYAPAWLHAMHVVRSNLAAIADAMEAGSCELIPLLREKLPPPLRTRLDRYVASTFTSRERTRRAAFLRALLPSVHESAHALAPRLWPHMAFVSTAVSGPLEVYEEEVRMYAGALPLRAAVYVASEGGIAAQAGDDPSEYELFVEHLFFEFIPEQEVTAAHPPTLLAGEVRQGERYELVLSNAAGFLRYRIGDVVEIRRRRPNGMLSLVMCHRTGVGLDALGEKTSERHLLDAIGRVSERWGVAVAEFTSFVRSDLSPMRYHVFVELWEGAGKDSPAEGAGEAKNGRAQSKEGSDDVAREEVRTDEGSVVMLTQAQRDLLDVELCAANEHYASYRESGKLSPLLCDQVPRGTMERYTAMLVEGGAAGGQVKVPHLLKNAQHQKFFCSSAL
eukprot:TRINITY_DN5642_c0_g1_i1.p1 TRINITY_DN5642_c0_g1~~TRINITY_DN5642_c0_g1_i1.p1  ORF type:complete len:640 (+),score=201.96 TRINITY_DN5642_c0_g1_i1:297-2216(+)